MKTDEYYMNIAMAVRKEANCMGRRVGAVLVKENRIISTGYNGTPEGVTNCLDGGCLRCKKKEQYKASVGYDVCVCVHAEQNSLLTAARFGISVEGSVAYSTMRPCFDCTKALLQARIKAICYMYPWSHPLEDLHEQYEIIQDKFDGGVRQVEMNDADEAWARGGGAVVASDLNGV
jgi:dCMP deaminase